MKIVEANEDCRRVFRVTKLKCIKSQCFVNVKLNQSKCQVNTLNEYKNDLESQWIKQTQIKVKTLNKFSIERINE